METHVTQETSVNLTDALTSRHRGPPGLMHWRHHISSRVFLQNCITWISSSGTNPKWETFCKITGLYSSEIAKSGRKGDLENVPDERRLKTSWPYVLYIILAWILQWGKKSYGRQDCSRRQNLSVDPGLGDRMMSRLNLLIVVCPGWYERMSLFEGNSILRCLGKKGYDVCNERRVRERENDRANGVDCYR